MKRASIGVGILLMFFLLAMFLMADAEVQPLDDTPMVTAHGAAR
jgi:hypothetical protein